MTFAPTHPHPHLRSGLGKARDGRRSGHQNHLGLWGCMPRVSSGSRFTGSRKGSWSAPRGLHHPVLRSRAVTTWSPLIRAHLSSSAWSVQSLFLKIPSSPPPLTVSPYISYSGRSPPIRPSIPQNKSPECLCKWENMKEREEGVQGDTGGK